MGVINTNISSLVGLNNLRLTNLGLQKTLERLSSGLRINVGADDPSGLAIAKGMEAQIGGMRVAVQNAEDGISMIHTADGSLAETHDILMRMRDLCLRGANEAVMTSADQKRLSDEFVSLKAELSRKAQAVTFNKKRLFWGSNRSQTSATFRYI
ncbi:MAG: flagellin, partial [bacterium]